MVGPEGWQAWDHDYDPRKKDSSESGESDNPVKIIEGEIDSGRISVSYGEGAEEFVPPEIVQIAEGIRSQRYDV